MQTPVLILWPLSFSRLESTCVNLYRGHNAVNRDRHCIGKDSAVGKGSAVSKGSAAQRAKAAQRRGQRQHSAEGRAKVAQTKGTADNALCIVEDVPLDNLIGSCHAEIERNRHQRTRAILAV